MPNASRASFESLAWGWHGQVKGLMPHLLLWDPGREPGCSTQGDSVVFICTLARWVKESMKEETISLH